MTSLPEMEVRSIRPALLLLWAATGLVLLIARANVDNLLLARTADRESELAMRVVTGASRAHLIRLLLTESALLAGMGSVAGLVVAESLINLIQGYGPGMVPRLAEIRLSTRGCSSSHLSCRSLPPFCSV